MTDKPGRELTDHERELLHSYVEAVDAVQLWEEARVKARDQLAASLGDLAGFVGDEMAVHVGRSRPRRFDSVRFKKDHALLYEQYRKEADNETVVLYVRQDVVARRVR